MSEIKLTVAQIERAMGYRNGESDEAVSDLVVNLLREADSFDGIRAEYRIFKDVQFNDLKKCVTIQDQEFDIQKIVHRQLKKSDSIAVFLCTAGREIGFRSRKSMNDGDLLTGYVYDVIGSEIVEAAADLMQAELASEMEGHGLNITNRYSPGYCKWNVEEQHKLFRFMPYNYCGIRLTPSALMDPVKSVSGIIGIGSEVRFNRYTCRVCDMMDCIYRNKRTSFHTDSLK